MLESNAAEAVRNNVLATRTLGELAVAAGVGVFVQLSTDKAVNPASVMGATKRLAELALRDLNTAGGGTRFAAVRFGNVLGASGSVVPLFREQIRRAAPERVHAGLVGDEADLLALQKRIALLLQHVDP